MFIDVFWKKSFSVPAVGTGAGGLNARAVLPPKIVEDQRSEGKELRAKGEEPTAGGFIHA